MKTPDAHGILPGTHKIRTLPGVNADSPMHFAHIISYPQIKDKYSHYKCAYVSIPTNWYKALPEEFFIKNDVTFHGIEGPVQNIPATWGELRYAVEHQYWLGIDFMEADEESQPEDDEIYTYLMTIVLNAARAYGIDI